MNPSSNSNDQENQITMSTLADILDFDLSTETQEFSPKRTFSEFVCSHDGNQCLDHDETPCKKVKSNVVVETKELHSSCSMIHESLKESIMCSICMGILFDPLMCSCGHSFCGECIHSWSKTKRNCAICRKQICETPVPNRAISDLIDCLFSEENASCDYSNDAEVCEWRDRVKHRNEDYKKQRQYFENFIKKLMSVKDKFNLTMRLNARNKKMMQMIISKFKEKTCRREIFEAIGFTEENVNTCPAPIVLNMCENLDIVFPISKIVDQTTKTCKHFANEKYARSKLLCLINKCK